MIHKAFHGLHGAALPAKVVEVRIAALRFVPRQKSETLPSLAFFEARHVAQHQQSVQLLESRLHKTRKELREILSVLAAPTPQLQVKERPAAPAAKPGLFEL